MSRFRTRIFRSAQAAIAVASLLVSAAALADIPPPVQSPPANGGATGVQAPAAPPETNPGSPPPATPPGFNLLNPIPAPSDLDSDPEHPDPSVGNHPAEGWYSDMYSQIYDMYSSFQQIESWAYDDYNQYGHDESWYVYVYASYVRVYMNNYYWNTYDQNRQPYQFSWGYASRGDFNYGYFYWIRPVYLKFVDAVSSYYQSYGSSSDFDYATYSGYMKPAMVNYHHFTRCNFGKNGLDAQARDDDATLPRERAAGIALASTDIVP